MKQLVTKIHYKEQKGYFILKSILFVLSIFYLLAIKFKNFLYSIKLLKENKINAYVICVGNLTTGGVGKTPLVCEISNYLAKNNKKVSIISRGYKGKLNNKKPNIIKDFNNNILVNDATLSGDEPYMLAKNTENVLIITSKDRLKGANLAIELGAEYIVMDDGFSNRKLKKDLTLLLVDSKKQFGNGFVLPLGPLREPKSEIKRTDKIIEINKNDKNSKEIVLNKNLKKEIIKCHFLKDFYYNLETKEEVKIDKNKNVCAFSGIGQPQQFYDYVKEDFNLIKTFDFEDHHKYQEEEIEKISKTCEVLVTTQKDEVKLENISSDLKNKIIVLKLKTSTNIESILNEQN